MRLTGDSRGIVELTDDFYLFQDTVSVCRPSFYAQRFQDFMAKTVFKKIPSCKWRVLGAVQRLTLNNPLGRLRPHWPLTELTGQGLTNVQGGDMMLIRSLFRVLVD